MVTSLSVPTSAVEACVTTRPTKSRTTENQPSRGELRLPTPPTGDLSPPGLIGVKGKTGVRRPPAGTDATRVSSPRATRQADPAHPRSCLPPPEPERSAQARRHG